MNCQSGSQNLNLNLNLSLNLNLNLNLSTTSVQNSLHLSKKTTLSVHAKGYLFISNFYSPLLAIGFNLV
jgi:hypothetical protein